MLHSKINQSIKFSSSLLILVFIQLIVVVAYLYNKKEDDIVLYSISFLLVLFALITTLRLEIDNNHFKYQLFPFHIKKKVIDLNLIEEIKIINVDALGDFLGWGIRYSSKYGKAYILNSEYGLFLKLKNGKKITFSLSNKDDLINFLETHNIPYTI